MRANLKHREVSRELLAEIATGKYGRGGVLPSESQLVQRFQVSRPTIARALRDLQAEGLVERRPGSGTYVRPREPQVAGTGPLGLLVPTRSSTEVLDVICGELTSLARAQDCPLMWGGSSGPRPAEDLTPEQALAACDQLIEQHVRGVFFAPFEQIAAPEKVNGQIAEHFTKAGVPLVLLDRDLVAFPRRTHFDLVTSNNLTGGCILAEHLIKLGAERLAFVARPQSAPTINARIAGVREALLMNRLEVPTDWVQFGDPEDLKFVRALTAGHRWDAVVCANDLTAARLLGTLEKMNLRVPQDLRVVGFDDAKYATLLHVPLTTMHQPCQAIATTAFRALLERIAEPTLPVRSMHLTPQLVVRESCGAYLPKAGAREPRKTRLTRKAVA